MGLLGAVEFRVSDVGDWDLVRNRASLKFETLHHCDDTNALDLMMQKYSRWISNDLAIILSRPESSRFAFGSKMMMSKSPALTAFEDPLAHSEKSSGLGSRRR